jgi:5'-deoxynucleotidase
MNERVEELRTDDGHFILRTQEVKRWHLVGTTKQQTLAEHLFLVGMMAMLFAQTSSHDVDCQMRCLTWGTLHDINEVVYGDIASPAKDVIGAEACEQLEYQADAEMPDALRAMVARQARHMNPAVFAYVKLADAVEAYCFIRDYGVGERARKAQSFIEARVRDRWVKYIEPLFGPHGHREDLRDLLKRMGLPGHWFPIDGRIEPEGGSATHV